jgi:hypothetical protein
MNYRSVIRAGRQAASAAGGVHLDRLGSRGAHPHGAQHRHREGEGDGREAGRGQERRAGSGQELARYGAGGVHRHDHGDAHGAAQLRRGLQQPGRRAGVLGLHVGERGRRHWHEHQAGREAVEQHRQQDGAGVGAVGPDLAQQDEAGGEAERADDDQRAGAEAGHEPRGEARDREDAEAEREEREPGRERAEAQDALDVLHHQEERRELAAHDERHDRQGGDAAPAAQEPGLDHRVGHPGLGERQGEEQQDAYGEAAEGACRGPAVLGCPDEGPHQGDRAQGRRHRADDVEAAGTAGGLGDEATGQDEHHEADRHVDEQRPAPRADVGDQAAEEQPEGRAS